MSARYKAMTTAIDRAKLVEAVRPCVSEAGFELLRAVLLDLDSAERRIDYTEGPPKTRVQPDGSVVRLCRDCNSHPCTCPDGPSWS